MGPGAPPESALRAGVAAATLAVLAAALVGAYVALGIDAVRRALARVAGARRAWALGGPALLWIAATAHAAASGQPVGTRAAAYAAYLLAPALVAVSAPPGPVAWPRAARVLAATALLWLPIELRLLPPLAVPGPAGTDVSRFLGLVDGLWLFLVATPLANVGYTFALRGREVAVAARAFAVYAVVALPVGLATGFIAWSPRLEPARVVTAPLVILLATAVPEEFLFRGLIQNTLARAWRPGPALAVSSVVFGLAHLPDPRYVALATGAGVAYGWVYARTGRVTAAAVTHALVDAVWVLLLQR